MFVCACVCMYVCVCVCVRQLLLPRVDCTFLRNSEFFISRANNCSFVPHIPKVCPVVTFIACEQRLRKAVIVKHR